MSSPSPGHALVPLCRFLGATFVYAGVYKLSNPRFLHSGADSYIGDQLAGLPMGLPAPSFSMPWRCPVQCWPVSASHW